MCFLGVFQKRRLVSLFLEENPGKMFWYQAQKTDSSQFKRWTTATFEEILAKGNEVLDSLWNAFIDGIIEAEKNRLHLSKNHKFTLLLRSMHSRYYLLKDLEQKILQLLAFWQDWNCWKKNLKMRDRCLINSLLLVKRIFTDLGWVIFVPCQQLAARKKFTPK